jgi:hypothetical protein
MATALADGSPIVHSFENTQRAIELLAANVLLREFKRRSEVAELEG